MGTRKKLGEILLEAGLVDSFQIQAALGHQRQWGGRLGEILVSKGFTSEDALAECLAAQLDLPRMDLYATGVDPAAAKLLPAEMAERHGMLPVRIEGTDRNAFVWVATADPTNLTALDDVQFRSGKRVRPAVVTASQIAAALRHAYHGEPLAPVSDDVGTELARETRDLPSEGAEAEMLASEAEVSATDDDLPFLDVEDVVDGDETTSSSDSSGASEPPVPQAAPEVPPAEPELPRSEPEPDAGSLDADLAALGLGDDDGGSAAAPAPIVKGKLLDAGRMLEDHEQAILDALDVLAAGEEAPAEVQRFVNPTQMLSALVRLLIRKGVLDEIELVEELQRK